MPLHFTHCLVSCFQTEKKMSPLVGLKYIIVCLLLCVLVNILFAALNVPRSFHPLDILSRVLSFFVNGGEWSGTLLGSFIGLIVVTLWPPAQSAMDDLLT